MIDYTVNGRCPPGCHECCSNFLTVSDEEINRIKEYVKENKIKINNPNNIFTEYVDRCPFVQRDGRCGVYPVRPEICDYFFCNRANEYRPFNHIGKKVVNMLKTFDASAFVPIDSPDEKELNKVYQKKKKEAGFAD